MAEELEVIIGANTKGIEDGATRAERALNDVQKSIKRLERDIRDNITISRGYKSAIDDLTRAYKAGDITQTDYSNGIRRLQRDEKETQIETKRLTAEMRNLQREQKQLSVGANNNAGAMNNLGRATGVNATPAMMDFSRVIQDAPYGINGVANNIQQLSAQFTYLQKSAGGTRAALKAMLSSLAGPAGIMFAISVVTTLLVSFGDKLFKSGEEAKSAADKLDDYVDSLQGVERAQLDASVSAAKEIVQLRLLSQQATNTALATDERKAAVNELRKLYPSYLKNMTDEQVLANGLAGAYDNITESIMRKAAAQAASNLMTKNLEEQFKLERQLASAEQDRAAAQEKINEKQRQFDAVRGTESEFTALKALERAQQDYNKALAESNDIRGQIQTRELENIDLKEAVRASGDLIVSPENVTLAGEVEDGVRVPVKPILDTEAFSKGVFSMQDFGDLGSGNSFEGLVGLNNMLKEQMELLKDAQSKLPATSKEYKELGEDIKFLEDRMGGFLSQLKASGAAGAEELAKLGESGVFETLNEKFSETSEFANIFASSVGTAMSQLGNVIQEQLAESGKAVEIIGGLFINTATQVVSQLLQAAIQEKVIGQIIRRTEQGKASAKGITVAVNAAAASGPLGMGLLPTFLASSQAMIQSAFAATEGFNFGGFVGDRNLVRMNGNERILTATEANTFNNLMQNRAVNTGQQRIVVDVSGQFVQRGNDLVATVNKAQQVESRLGGR